MPSSLSNLINNLSEGTHRVKYKYGGDDKKCKACGIKYKHCDFFFSIQTLKMIYRIQIFDLR